MLQLMPQHISSLFQGAKVLVVDDVYDADSGAKGLDAIRAIAPDVVLVDWEMPGRTVPPFLRQCVLPVPFPIRMSPSSC
jgi:CheY-like chemotaxis protein